MNDHIPLNIGGKLGGARRYRTVDLLHAMQALSQLSYSPKFIKLYLSALQAFARLCLNYGAHSMQRT